jgi:hypothetical protein
MTDDIVDHIFNQVRSEMTARYRTPHNDTSRKQALCDAAEAVDSVTVEVWVGGQVYKRRPAGHRLYLQAIERLLEDS